LLEFLSKLEEAGWLWLLLGISVRSLTLRQTRNLWRRTESISFISELKAIRWNPLLIHTMTLCFLSSLVVNAVQLFSSTRSYLQMHIVDLPLLIEPCKNYWMSSMPTCRNHLWTYQKMSSGMLWRFFLVIFNIFEPCNTEHWGLQPFFCLELQVCLDI
jgi:hypothetical protein